MSLPNTLEVDAPAKVNLSLRVLGRRPDGSHDIQSLIAPVTLADRLVVHGHADPSAFRTLSLALEITGSRELTRGVPADESNLILRSATALAAHTEVRGFAEFVLDKRIPTAAGLGGGSSDAAAALSALNRLWGCDLDGGTLAAIGASVGSDVPAFLPGGPVRVSGRGDVVEPAPPIDRRLLLVAFDFGVRTEEAYGWWDEDGGPTAPDGPHPNDLEEPVMRRHPRIREVRDLLVGHGAAAAFMCGSGPTVVAVLAEGAEPLAPEAARELELLSGRAVMGATTR